ncbi:MAG TPA: MmcQ/YjbR family DNA-binding protein [Polyangiaceae bacterium]|nr:MmcQ/YjbR family DNA-binding protein [Polyangiaceae bacterium]
MVQPTKPKPDALKAEAAIAKLALAYPDVIEENPWGHRAFKVKKKTFLFLGADGEGVSLSVKLPHSGVAALSLEYTEPTHYGLGKSGWVTARFTRGSDVPLPVVAEWLKESFEAIAPAKLKAKQAQGAKAKAKAAPKSERRPSAGSKLKTKAKTRAKAKSRAKTKARPKGA